MQLCREEAEKRGVTKEKYQAIKEKVYSKQPKKKIHFWKELPLVSFPKKCSGKIL